MERQRLVVRMFGVTGAQKFIRQQKGSLSLYTLNPGVHAVYCYTYSIIYIPTPLFITWLVCVFGS